jgi:hypothetical protein
MNTMRGFASDAQAEDTFGSVHLSEEQIDDHLIGELDRNAAAHLAECEECSERVATAFEPMATFRDVTIAWSERRSATMPIPAVEADALVWQRRAGWAMAACALVVGISITSNGRKAEMLRVSGQAVQTATVAATRSVNIPAAADQRAVDDGDEDRAARYSGDNRMLKAIDNELDASVDTPAAMGLETVSDQPRTESAPMSVQD